jgi:hypothetical protein
MFGNDIIQEMINWNTDEEKFKEQFPREYRSWRLVQLINYGLEDEKLDQEEVKLAWPEIKDRLNPDRRKTLEFLLWNQKWRPEQGLLPNRSNYWIWRSKNNIS